jgi:hypothetical protein
VDSFDRSIVGLSEFGSFIDDSERVKYSLCSKFKHFVEISRLRVVVREFGGKEA